MKKKVKNDRSSDDLGLKKPNRWIFIVGITAFVVIAGLVGAAIFNKGKPPVTKDLTPGEVVELFYQSVNKMDTDMIIHSVDQRKVNMSNNRIIINTLTGKLSQMEDASHINPLVASDSVVYTPIEWYELGKPALESGERVMGIYNLEIKKIRENQYEAIYDYYLTGIPEEGKPVLPFVTRCVDICTLAQKKSCWIIVDIKQESEKEISLE